MRLTKANKKKLITSIVTIGILLVAVVSGTINKEELLEILGIEQASTNIINENTTINETNCVVERVVDGDTFEIMLNGNKEKVRLIGIDTPESVHPDKNKNSEEGKTASKYTKELIENKNVKLEFDVQQRDKYGRLLAYVYLEDGTMLNKKLLEDGYAKIATYPPNVKYVEEFKQIESKAREQEKGLWQK